MVESNGNGQWRKYSVITTIVLFFLIQLGGGIRWASLISRDVQNISTRLEEKTQDRYHRAEALADFALRDSNIKHNTEKIKLLYDSYKMDMGDIKSSLTRLEDKISNYLLEDIKINKHK